MLDAATLLEATLTTTDAHSITNLFLFLITGIFIISLLFAVFDKGRIFIAYTPTLLTSLGILGTFIGIVIGLLDFDPKNIDGSITLLLNGLKTAFITSLAGMAFTIVYKLLGTTFLFKENHTTTEVTDVEPKDILKAITHQDQHLLALIDVTTKQEQHFAALLETTVKQNQRFDVLLNAVVNQDKHLIALKKAISGEEESSLTGQIKLLRSDVNDNYKSQQNSFNTFSEKLWLNLKNFSEILSKSATEQIIEALKDVISDFNKNLTEQFGENFRALDESVKKLVIWQMQYSQQLEQMIDNYSEGVKAIVDIEASVGAINKETKAIPNTMANLKVVMDVNQHQITELGQHLAAFKELKDQAVKAVPEMQIHVEKTVENIALASEKASEGYQLLLLTTENVQKSFTTSIKNIQNKMQLSIESLVKKQIVEMEKSFSVLAKGSYSLQSKTKNIQESLTTNIEDIQQQMKQAMTLLIEKQIEEMNRSFSAMENEVKKSVDTTGKAVNKQLEMIDASMTQEVNRVMTEMGGALGSIAGQFTSDYKQLTLAMRTVVQEGARV